MEFDIKELSQILKALESRYEWAKDDDSFDGDYRDIESMKKSIEKIKNIKI